MCVRRTYDPTNNNVNCTSLQRSPAPLLVTCSHIFRCITIVVFSPAFIRVVSVFFAVQTIH